MITSLSILRESKVDKLGREVENRVIFTPKHILEIRNQVSGIRIFVEDGAGQKINTPNSEYQEAGAEIVSHEEALKKDMILGVKETRPEDFQKLGRSIWLSYQHFAESRKRTELALKTKAIFMALETIEERKEGSGFFPCLAPMSEAAGRIVARHADMHALLSNKIISSGLSQTGMKGLKVTILGSGTVGQTAAKEFSARGYEVILLGREKNKTISLDKYYKDNELKYPKVKVLENNPENLKSSITGSSFVVSAMYTAGRRPEKAVKKEHLKLMADEGCAYVVDIDQGGGIEGAVETSILDIFNLPRIEATDIYCFAPPNIPSLGAKTASDALGKTVLPYVIEILKSGLESAAEKNPAIKSGINVMGGKIVHPGLASVFPDL
jgi:alanine dehydrogenase